MSVESTTTIAGLNAAWPAGSDVKAEGDDHIRLLKTVVKNHFGAGDLWYGQKITPDRWVWNDKADGSGTDVAIMSEVGAFTLAKSLTLTGTTPDASIGFTSLDMSFGTRFITGGANAFVMNNNTAFTGTDFMYVREDGILVMPYAQKGVSGGDGLNLFANIPSGSNSGGHIGLRGSASGGGVSTNGIDFYTGATGAFLKTLSLRNDQQARFTSTVFTGGMHYIYGTPSSVYPAIAFRTAEDVGESCRVTYAWNAPAERYEVYFTAAGGVHRLYMNGTMEISGAVATKVGGGSWSATSDERIKNVLGDYESGLDAIVALRPVRYSYKGNDTQTPPAESFATDAPLLKMPVEAPYANSMHYGAAVDATEFIGLIAQEAEVLMPEMVSQSEGFIDGAAVADIRTLDTGPLIFALVNAVKELSGRIEALEAAA